MPQPKGEPSLTRQRRGFTVQASPFNAVKLDLALILFVGVVLVFVHSRLVSNQLGQLGLLAAYGIVAMCWLIFRTRRVIKQLDQVEHVEGQDDSHMSGG